LVTDRDLSKDTGKLVEVKGRAADMTDGKVRVETKVGTSGGEKTERSTEVHDPDLHYLGLKSIKKLSSTCS
jgi:hypothetical protein